MDNYDSVIQQMEAFGVDFVATKDLPLRIPSVTRKTCGRKGKWWYWLQEFRPRAGGCYIVGKFGSYKTGDSRKVEIDWKPLSDAERERFRAERQAAAAAAVQAKAEASSLAALSAVELWHAGRPDGLSPYLVRKGVAGESCRYLNDGSVLVPLLRYDLPRAERLRGVQRIYPNGRKLFTKGFGKPGTCTRLGEVTASTWLILVCEGYATGLTIRAAVGHELPVFVALDAYNLQDVMPLLRALFPAAALLICADDDWQSTDHEGPNPGRRRAMTVARKTERCGIVAPVFPRGQRADGDTDFNDLQARCGLATVQRQLGAAIDAIRRSGRGR